MCEAGNSVATPHKHGHNDVMIELRSARETDADDMSAVQNAIFRAGLRSSSVTVDQIRERYLAGDHRVACTVTDLDGRVVGFQSLKRAWPDNPYGVETGWGIIGTHIHPDLGRHGLGTRLWSVTLEAAQEAGLLHIDATIGANSEPALAYYRSLGFVPYREADGAIPHRFDI